MSYPPFHERSADEPMVVTREEFSDLFPSESTYLERKTGLSNSAIGEAVVAFSNTEGGVILIGVRDDGTVLGRELTPTVETQLHEAIGHVHNPGRYDLKQLLVGNLPVTVVSVHRRREGFAQTSDGRVLVRRGARNVALVGDELHRLVNERSLGRFEATVIDVTIEDADRERVREICRAYEWPDSSDPRVLLVQRSLMEDSGRLTVAGALLLLPDPAIAISKAYIEILRYPDSSLNYDQRIQIVGPVQHQIEEAARRVAEAVGSELVILGLRRHELPRLPLVVIREALANAVAHRSYELTGTPIRIQMRPQEVVISSPGSLPEPVTVDNIRQTQAARNPVVINALRRLNLAEDVGRGVDVMQDSMHAELLEGPFFEDSGDSVSVRLPIRSPISPTERAWIRELEMGKQIQPEDRVLLIHAARGEQLTNTRARELLGTENAAAARAALQRLRDSGLLVQRGKRGGASYVLGRVEAPPAAMRLSADQLAELVMEMASEGPVRNADVREATGLDRVDALRLLDGLVDAGRLERRGERRGTHYVIPGTLPLAAE
jgi:ATP-dependent DNA helicase RecG